MLTETIKNQEGKRPINLKLLLLGILDKPSAQLQKSSQLTIQPPHIARGSFQEKIIKDYNSLGSHASKDSTELTMA